MKKIRLKTKKNSSFIFWTILIGSRESDIDSEIVSNPTSAKARTSVTKCGQFPKRFGGDGLWAQRISGVHFRTNLESNHDFQSDDLMGLGSIEGL